LQKKNHTVLLNPFKVEDCQLRLFHNLMMADEKYDYEWLSGIAK